MLKRSNVAFRFLALFLVLVMAGCSAASAPTADAPAASGSAPAPAASTPAEDEAPFVITWMNNYNTTEPPAADNPIVAELEKLGNVKLDIDYVPAAGHEEKLSVIIASADLPMITTMTGSSKPLTIESQAIRGGMFWKLEDYIGLYGEKMGWELSPIAWENAKVAGELWGLPRERAVSEDGFIYRKDWMEKLGLEAPKNEEELYNVLYQFVHGDPNGDGTVTGGLAQAAGLDSLYCALGPYFGMGNRWDISADGKLTPICMNPGWLRMMQFVKRLYDDGLMNADFAVITDPQRDEMMGTGLWGMEFVSIDKGKKFWDAMKSHYPNSDLSVQQFFDDAPEKYLWARSGFSGKFYFAKSAIQDEATLNRVLQFMDVIQNHSWLMEHGVEGLHWSYSDEAKREITVSPEQNEVRGTDDVVVLSAAPMLFHHKNRLFRSDLEPYFGLRFILGDDPTYAKIDPTAPLTSEAWESNGTNLEQIIDDATTQFITGAIDEAGWNAAVENWRSSGGDDVIAEYQAAYDAANA